MHYRPQQLYFSGSRDGSRFSKLIPNREAAYSTSDFLQCLQAFSKHFFAGEKNSDFQLMLDGVGLVAFCTKF